MKKIKLNKGQTVILIVFACVVIIAFLYVVQKSIQNYRFASAMENIYVKNKTAIFSIDKIVLYSSANAIDNSEGQTMQDLNVCQFTDMAIYIDNMVNIKELIKEANALNASVTVEDDSTERKVKEHTVKELYIDNININTATDKGQRTLTYKNPLSFGKFNAEDASNNRNEQEQKINFEIIYTNVENDQNDYTNPTFYADCSNPITLNYMNKNIVTGYSVSTQDTQITFDGKILQSVGINLDDINSTISFDIHIKNELNQNFVCNVWVNVPLKNESRSIYNGYMYGMENNLQEKYAFFKK